MNVSFEFHWAFSTFGRCFGFGARGYMMPHAFGYRSYGGFLPFLGIFRLLVGLGLLILVVYLVVRAFGGGFKVGSGNGKSSRDSKRTLC